MRARTFLTMMFVTFSLMLFAFTVVYKSPMEAARADTTVTQLLKQFTANGCVIVSETEHQYRAPISISGASAWGYCRIEMIDENAFAPIVIYADISWDADKKGYFCTGCRVEKE